MEPNLLGDELRRLRNKAGLGPIKVACERLGVSHGTLGAYERGETKPDIEFLVTFADVTGASFSDLLAIRLRDSNLEKARELADLVAFYGDSKRDLQERAGKYHGSLERLRRATDLTVKILEGVGEVPDSVAHQLQEFLFHHDIQEKDIGWLRALLEKPKH